MRSRPILSATAALLLPFSATAELREFEDSFGRTMRAELVSHTGADADSVKIRKEGGEEFDVEVSRFSKKDQAVIREWMRATPATINYAFRIEAAKQKLGGGTRTGYDVEVSNLSRQKVSGIVVKTRSMYEYFYTPYGSDYYSYGGKMVGKEEKFEIPGEMKFNQTAKFSTGRTYNLLGLMVRVYDPQGKVVGERKFGSTKVNALEWGQGRSRSTRSGGPERSRVTIED